MKMCARALEEMFFVAPRRSGSLGREACCLLHISCRRGCLRNIYQSIGGNKVFGRKMNEEEALLKAVFHNGFLPPGKQWSNLFL